MTKVKLFNRMVLITTLSAFCTVSTGCSNAEKPVQTESSTEEQTEEIVINNTDFPVEESNKPESSASATNETTTPPSSTQVQTSNTETSIVSSDIIPDTSTDMMADNDIVQPGESKTIDGYQLVDGANLPITATFEITEIQRGEAAYAVMQSNNADLPKPDSGMEYIIVTLNVTYNEGELDNLDMYENIASLEAARKLFALSNGSSNAEPMTAYLNNSIYNLSINKGETSQGAVAFLHKTDSTEPLNFIGFGQIIKFNISS